MKEATLTPKFHTLHSVNELVFYRMITLFEELVLLKEFEKRENLLMGKVSQKMQEKDEMEEKVFDKQHRYLLLEKNFFNILQFIF